MWPWDLPFFARSIFFFFKLVQQSDSKRFAKWWKEGEARMNSSSAVTSSNTGGNSVNIRQPLKWDSWLIVIYENHHKGEKSHFTPKNAQGLLLLANIIVMVWLGRHQKHFFHEPLTADPNICIKGLHFTSFTTTIRTWTNRNCYVSQKNFFFTDRLPLIKGLHFTSVTSNTFFF